MWRLSLLSRRFLASKTIKTPPMADSITEGTLAQWHKSVGDYVKRDELIATVETDKVDVVVNSPEVRTCIPFTNQLSPCFVYYPLGRHAAVRV